MDWFVTSLRENPELAIFLTLASGFVIGRVLQTARGPVTVMLTR